MPVPLPLSVFLCALCKTSTPDTPSRRCGCRWLSAPFLYVPSRRPLRALPLGALCCCPLSPPPLNAPPSALSRPRPLLHTSPIPPAPHRPLPPHHPAQVRSLIPRSLPSADWLSDLFPEEALCRPVAWAQHRPALHFLGMPGDLTPDLLTRAVCHADAELPRRSARAALALATAIAQSAGASGHLQNAEVGQTVAQRLNVPCLCHWPTQEHRFGRLAEVWRMRRASGWRSRAVRGRVCVPPDGLGVAMVSMTRHATSVRQGNGISLGISPIPRAAQQRAAAVALGAQ